MKNINRFTAIHSIYRFFLITVSLLIIIEIIDTIVLGLFPQISPLNGILLDVVLNSVVISPILYFLIFRPWTVHLAERKQAEKALRVSETKYRGIIDQSHEGFVLADEQGNILIWNAGMASITGITHREAFGMPIWDIQSQLIPDHKVTEEILEQLRNGIKNILESQMEWKGELREQKIKCADGTNKIIIDSSFLVSTDSAVYFGSIIQDITDRKNGEEELRSSEKKYRFMFENNPQPMFIFDLGTLVFLEVNQAAINQYGYSKEEFMSMTILDIHQAKDIQDLVKEIERDHKGIIPSSTWTQIRKNGEIVSVVVTAHSIIFNGRIARHILINDISERTKAEEKLRESESQNRALINAIPDLIFINRRDGKYLAVHVSDSNMLLHKPEKFLHRKLEEVLPKYLADQFLKAFADALDLNKVQSVNYTLPINEEEKYFEARIVPSSKDEVISIVRDVTKHVLAEEALRKSEERFRTLLQDVQSVAVQGYAPDGTTKYWNQFSERLYGFSAQEAIGRNLLDLIIPPNMRSDVEQAIQQMAETGKPIPTSELSLMRKDGSHVSVLSSHSIVKQPGQDQELFCFDIDLTEQKQVEEALRKSQEQYRMLSENTSDGVAIYENNKIQYVSTGYLKISGYNRSEIENISLDKIITFLHEDDSERIINNIKAAHLQQTKTFQNQYRLKTKKGEYVWLEDNINAEYDSSGKHLRSIVHSRNISDRVHAEELLRNTQKIKSIGLLSSGIAHDYNNLLNIMIGNIMLATKKISADHQAVKFLERSLSAMKSAATLTKQILAYSGKGRFLVQTIDMVAMVQDHLTLAKASIPKNVSLQTNLSPTQVNIKGDPAQIEQIVMNLIINSGEAIGENQGVVSIEVSRVSFTNDELTAFGVLTNTTLEQQEYASLRVSDNGSGMNKETMDKIFDPFFTTKFVGRGLGLSAVLGIIRGHKGGITIESKEGAGTAVCVLLPIARVPVNTIEPLSEKQDPIQASGKTVLLIDDERDIIEMLNNVLESGNYNRQSTIDPVIGVELYKEHWRNIDVVILDYSMPKMNGKEVLIELQKINSNVKVIISTGYSEEEISDLMGNFKPTSFIQKPYTPNALLSLVSTVLAMK